MQQIILLDAPSVLGWQKMREIEQRCVLTMIKQGIGAAIAEGRLRKRAVDPLALFLLGALSETAMSIARSDDPASAMRAAKSELDGILEALA
jgi:hypothetical protein